MHDLMHVLCINELFYVLNVINEICMHMYVKKIKNKNWVSTDKSSPICKLRSSSFVNLIFVKHDVFISSINKSALWKLNTVKSFCLIHVIYKNMNNASVFSL